MGAQAEACSSVIPSPGLLRGYEAWPGAASAPVGASYQRREPEKTALHRVVREKLATLLAEERERSTDGFGLPRYVEKEFQRYLVCGILSEGFARVICRECGHEAVVGFSCKCRGVCPSCTSRRAHEAAAHLVDRVVPKVPVRQWVLSFPKQLRFVLARDKQLLGAALGCLLKAVFAFHRQRARKLGSRGGQPGAISYLQYFGSAIQLTPHFHCIVPDGVFVEENETEAPEFHPLPPPTDDEVEGVLLTVMKRLHALFTRKGLFEEDESRAGPLGALESLQHEAARGQRSLPLPDAELRRPLVGKPRSAFREGFSLHADLHLHENDREGLERLFLYAGRGALANDRLSLLPDGRVSYRMKRVAPDGRSHLVCSAVDFLRRLASITPPPRINLLRFHGVFAPNCRLRARIVPAPEPDAPSTPEQVPFEFAAPATAPTPEAPKRHTYSWGELMKRTFQTDVLECERCGGRMRVTAFVTDAEMAQEILGRLGLPNRSPPLAAAAGPPQLALAFRN